MHTLSKYVFIPNISSMESCTREIGNYLFMKNMNNLLDLKKYFYENKCLINKDEHVLDKYFVKKISTDKCFVYEFNFKDFNTENNKTLEELKSYYINMLGRKGFSFSGKCNNSENCFMYFTEKGLLSFDEKYECNN